MRAPSVVSLLVCLLATSRGARGDEHVGLWIAPGDPTLAGSVRAALARAVTARGRVLDESVVAPPAEPSLRGALAEALAAYDAVRLEDAYALLVRVRAEAERLGGGDLDGRGLGDLHLHLALVAQELGKPEEAWESIVRAVRVDPSRTLDPARIPPRIASAHRRAQLELGGMPAVELEVRVPAEARVRIDGEERQGGGRWPRRLVAGAHHVWIALAGYEPVRGMYTFGAGNEVLAPALRPLRAGASESSDGARLERTPDGWRLGLRASTGGLAVEASAPISAGDAPAVVDRVVDRVLGPLPARRPPPLWRRWWVWTLVGAGVVAATAIALPLALTADTGPAAGSIGGTLPPLR